MVHTSHNNERECRCKNTDDDEAEPCGKKLNCNCKPITDNASQRPDRNNGNRRANQDDQRWMQDQFHNARRDPVDQFHDVRHDPYHQDDRDDRVTVSFRRNRNRKKANRITGLYHSRKAWVKEYACNDQRQRLIYIEYFCGVCSNQNRHKIERRISDKGDDLISAG